mgnify:CR=1 FL=1
MWVDGKPVPFSENGYSIKADLPRNPGISVITLLADPVPGYPGTAFFKSPVRMSCSGGKMPSGDWTQQGALRWFSGGIRYTKTIDIDDPSGQWILDLGDVDATCEVSVNSDEPRFIINIPYTIDLTESLKKGENTISVLVYSSLANHCASNPSPYKGTPRAGLMGPVKLQKLGKCPFTQAVDSLNHHTGFSPEGS